MIQIQFSSGLDNATREMARGCVTYILDNCDPAQLVKRGFKFDEFDRGTHVLAFGKASVGMSLACAEALGPRCAGGVVLAPQEIIAGAYRQDGFRYYGVDHPMPTSRNVEATKILAQYARSIPDSENCIVCISGGGSAHLCSPKQGVSLGRIVETTNALNAQGAAIEQINDARRSLEVFKGGGLAKLLTHTHCVEAIVLSDVLGNDLEIIASGPMMNQKNPVGHTIIGDHQTALAAAAGFLVSQKHPIHFRKPMISGDAQNQGIRLAEVYMNADRPPSSACVIAGETTVNATDADGVGGPSLELALSCALRLTGAGAQDWVVLGLATDGMDGPSRAAGVIVTSQMLLGTEKRATAQQSLENHDSLGFLDSIGATIRTGPTGTNLNDVCMVWPCEAIQSY